MAVGTRRIGLTRDGYNGISLHQNIAARFDNPTLTQTSHDLSDINHPVSSPDVLAPPESSSDEEEVRSKRKASEALLDAGKEGSASRPHKKQALSKESTRVKRSTRSTAIGLDISSQKLSQDEMDSREEEIFSASQQRRRVRGYGKSQSYEQRSVFKPTPNKDDGFKGPPNPAAQDPRDDTTAPTFIMPRGLKSPKSQDDEKPKFITRKALDLGEKPQEPSDRSFQKKVLRITDPVLRTELQQATKVGQPIARTYSLDNMSEPSSIEALADEIFSPVKKRRFGSESSSELSSPPSSPDLDHRSMEPKSTTMQCPLCGVNVSRDFYESYNNGRPLRFVDQPRFCHDHRLDTARSDWTRLGYPTIDWAEFATARITKKHMDALRKIIYDKRPSHYSEVLSTHAAKGTKALQTYFKEGIVDIVSAGYYGSKGSKIMASTIQKQLSKQLHDSARKNDLVRDAGVGGYVQGVLVPELTVLLVKEDFNLQDDDDERARKIMHESLDIGNLVHSEEEDTIVQNED